MYLKFYRAIIQELLQDDALVILASGLGILEIICAFVELHANDRSLVFILNVSEREVDFIQMRLASTVKQHTHNLFFHIRGDVSAQDRQHMYLQGGCIAITARVLVADLLSNICPFKAITGLLINNADQICKLANLSFVVEIVQRNNPDAFIRGFSENAEKFSDAVTSLALTMQRLFVSKVSIWPRYQPLVNESFSAHIDIVESTAHTIDAVHSETDHRNHALSAHRAQTDEFCQLFLFDGAGNAQLLCA